MGLPSCGEACVRARSLEETGEAGAAAKGVPRSLPPVGGKTEKKQGRARVASYVMKKPPCQGW